MTPEERERMMEFLLAQQAQFEARLEKEREERREAEAHLREADERQREAHERLRESQATLTAAILRVTELVEDLTTVQKAGEERLSALIAVVEKHITGPGHSAPPRQ